MCKVRCLIGGFVLSVFSCLSVYADLSSTSITKTKRTSKSTVDKAVNPQLAVIDERTTSHDPTKTHELFQDRYKISSSGNLDISAQKKLINHIKLLRQKYTKLRVNKNLTLQVDQLETEPLGSDDTRILKINQHLAPTNVRDDLGSKGYGVKFRYEMR